MTREPVEVERKFLVGAEPEGVPLGSGKEIAQGYLAVGGGAEVRLRRKAGACFLTVKRGAGLMRTEYEIVLSSDQFDSLWPATEGRRVEKTRFEVSLGALIAEFDRYRGGLDGLLTVEVEFGSVDEAEAFDPPPWFGREVTQDPCYKNNRLALDGLPQS